MSKTEAVKSDYTVTSAFVWEGNIVSPGKGLSLTKTQAAPLEQRGKVEAGKLATKAKAATTKA